MLEKTEEPPSAESQASAQPNPGWFQPGNTKSLRHGGRSARVAAGLMPEQAEAAAALPIASRPSSRTWAAPRR